MTEGYDTPEARIVRMVQDAPLHDDSASGVETNTPAPEFSDEWLTRLFVEKHADRIRYVALWGRWLVWNGVVWENDIQLIVRSLIRDFLASVAAKCEHKRLASNIASAKTVYAVERLAQSDRMLAASVNQWDRDPFKLNTPDGEIDLLTGNKTLNTPDSYCTKITAVAPGGDCPKWMDFLNTIHAGDANMINYLQRSFGYFLTGSVEENALFFGHGSGANGKSVLLSTEAGVMGSYSKTAPIETFTVSSMGSHPTELAGLQGARLVCASETEQGRRWKESLIKQLTGGDTIAARFMRQDFFTFQFIGKIFIAGNHAPSLRSVDEAIKRRLHLIPFSVRIPPEQRDHQLTEKLREEWSGILAWGIEGSRKWREHGLSPPTTVVNATADYLEEEDAFGQWLAERCEVRENALAVTNDLFSSWKDWAESSGQFVGTSTSFGKKLNERGFKKARGRKGEKARNGLRLLAEYELEAAHMVDENFSGGSYVDDGF